MEDHWFDARTPRVGGRSPDAAFVDDSGKPQQLSSLVSGGPLLLVFFSGPEDAASRSLLREYRDLTLALRRAGVSVAAVSRAPATELLYLRMEMGLGFPLLADPDGAQLDKLGLSSRTGVLLLDSAMHVRQRALDRRAAPEALLAFIKRGGAKVQRHAFREALGHLWQSLAAAFRPRHLAR